MLLSEFIQSDRVITKSEAAKMAHEYLKDVLKEEDITDIRPAGILKDLYDCRVCVDHVAQMYLKGIIAPASERVFGMDDYVDAKEALMIFERLENPKRRVIPKPVTDFDNNKLTKIDYLKACEIKRENPSVRIIDVSSENAFKNGFSDFIENIPLSKLALNPHCLGDDLYATVILVCETGKSASVAGEYVISAGYKNVFYAEYGITS